MALDPKSRKISARDRADDRALLRLAEPGAYGRVTPEGGLAIFVARNSFASPVVNMDRDGLMRLSGEELLCQSGKQEDERLISAQGLARLARRRTDDLPFRRQHQSLEMREMRGPDGAVATVRVNQAESPLGWLASHVDRMGKPLISPEQFMAGERLRRDFTLANLSPRVTALWGMPAAHAGRSGGADSSSLNDTMIAAKRRVWSAFDAVGPDLGAILLQICCHLNGLAEAERQLGWPVRAGKVVLRIALDRLAAHYGISASSDAGGNREKTLKMNRKNSGDRKLHNKENKY